jgi:hypothetical protein
LQLIVTVTTDDEAPLLAVALLLVRLGTEGFLDAERLEALDLDVLLPLFTAGFFTLEVLGLA